MSDARKSGLLHQIVDNYLLLVLGTVAAIVWANVDFDSYARFAAALHFPINDIGMAFFFALAAKEIVEATFPGGALASPREAAVPLLAAVGGMVVPALLFSAQVTFSGQSGLARGWAIPCATDIAFSYMAARMIFPRHHPALPFLLLLAIADDAFGLVLLALFYPTGPLSPGTLVALMIPAVGIAWWLRRRRVRNLWAYTILAGGLSWFALYSSGLHPALALVPIVPFMPHVKRDLGYFNVAVHGHPDTMHAFAEWWRIPVQVILLLFGLANAGVTVSNTGPATWIVLSSLLIGKPLGILTMTYLGTKCGLRMPVALSYRHVLVLGVAAGVGFTVALFFSTAAFPLGEMLDQAKTGALLSFVAFPLAVLCARVMRLTR